MSNYYERMEEQLINNNAKKITDEMLVVFTEELKKTASLFGYYKLSLENTDNTLDLYNQYLEKNKELEKKIKDSNNDILTNDRKTFYETEAHEKLDAWHKVFKWFYNILGFLVIISLYFTEMPISLGKKMIIIIVVLIYPIIIGKILTFIYQQYESIKKQSPKNVYNNL
jgi:hypothetical protein